MNDRVPDSAENTINANAGRGGLRQGAGRKLSRWGKLFRRNARINQEMIDYCTMRGEGDFSEGLRIAVSESLEAYARSIDSATG